MVKTGPSKNQVDSARKKNEEDTISDSLYQIIDQKYLNRPDSLLDGHSAQCDPAEEEEIKRQNEMLDLISKKSPLGKKPPPKTKGPLTAAQKKALAAKEYAAKLKKEKEDAIAAKKEAARLAALNVKDDSYTFKVPDPIE